MSNEYKIGYEPKYRVGHLLADLGWVDLDLGCSTIMLGAVGSYRSGPPAWELVNPTQVCEEMPHPVQSIASFMFSVRLF